MKAFNSCIQLSFLSAFEQFAELSLYWSHINCMMHLTNVSLVMSYLFAMLSFIMTYSLIIKRQFGKYIWNIWQKFYKICIHAADGAFLSKFEQFSLIFFLFIIIIVFNVSGLATYSLTITAILTTPFFLSYSSFVWMYSWGVQNKGWSTLGQFLPQGIPAPLVLFFTAIEIASNCARLISLSVRLFANMVAGHIMFKLITSGFLKFLSPKFWLSQLAILALFTMVYSLEFFISLLQAFVFILLLNLYLRDFIILDKG